MKKEFQIAPIGYIHTGKDGYNLTIENKYIPALKELETFSHVNVLWWCHMADSDEYRKVLQAEKPYKNAPSTMGIFATRSPLRPNPIALTTVQILKVDLERGVIYIPYIDAEDGTPVIDLKPYTPSVDRVKKVITPQWCSHWPEWYEDSGEFNWAGEFVNAR